MLLKKINFPLTKNVNFSGSLQKILWNDQKLEPVPIRTWTVDWASRALVLLNRQEATDVIKAIKTRP